METEEFDMGTEAVIDGAGTPPAVNLWWAWQDCDPSSAGTQVMPSTANPVAGEGSTTEICIYAVVSDPNGIADITDVYFDVYHPDESYKVQVHMTRITSLTTIESKFDQAVGSNLITAADKTLYYNNGIVKNVKALYRGCFTYHTHQIPGWYGIKLVAVDQNGNTNLYTTDYSKLQVLQVLVLALDFDGVNFGSILPNTEKWVAGDDTFDICGGPCVANGENYFATLWNQGNVPLQIEVHSDQMLGIALGKTIDRFDVQLLGDHYDYDYDQEVILGGPLMPCTPTQIDFSIHPGSIPADTYQGTLYIEGYPQGTYTPGVQ